MHRYIWRGSKGIALLTAGSGGMGVRYVFDVSDTGTRRESRDVEPWLDDRHGVRLSGERTSQPLDSRAARVYRRFRHQYDTPVAPVGAHHRPSRRIYHPPKIRPLTVPSTRRNIQARPCHPTDTASLFIFLPTNHTPTRNFIVRKQQNHNFCNFVVYK